MEIIEKIRKEIERLYDDEAPAHDQQCEFEDGYFTGIATISKFLDSLQEEEKSPMEILAEKCPQEEIDPQIARCVADHWWEMAGEETPTNLEEAAEKYEQNRPTYQSNNEDVRQAFIAGAEWQARQLLQGAPMPEDTVLFNKGVEEGRRLEREDMLGDEISCEIDWYDGPILNYPIDQLCEVLSKMDIDVGDKVRIIVLKEEE